MAKHVDSQIYVDDVYDLAADIGKEFEKLIDEYGTDIIKELMTKVILTLEYLESSTEIIDKLQCELYDIKSKVQQLEYEKLERAEFRSKLDQVKLCYYFGILEGVANLIQYFKVFQYFNLLDYYSGSISHAILKKYLNELIISLEFKNHWGS